VQLVKVIKNCEVFIGSVMGDLQTRRAIVEGIDAEGSFQKIIAKVPLAEMDGYSSSLRSITQGRAKFKSRFHEYAPVPYDVQRRLIEEYSKKEQEELV
jgi:elongation factor G